MTTKQEESQENRQHCWIAALHEEATGLLGDLGLCLSRPVILIHEGSNHWGRWDPLNLTISMSRTLIEECPWWVVVEIFKHELAHLASEQTSGALEPPHGPTFRMFCEALEVEPWARGASCGKPLEELRALSDWRTRPASNATVKYRRRLQKLLALAESSNEHEAYLEALIDLMGRPEDVVLAEYVHSFLHKSSEALWQSRRKQTGAKGLRARNSYIRGLLAVKLDQKRGCQAEPQDSDRELCARVCPSKTA